MLRVFVLVILVYAGLLGLTYWGFADTPRGFIPSQDMGYLLVNVQLPDSAATERTQKILDQINEIAHQVPGVNATVGVCGQSLLLNAFGSNFGTMFVTLDGFDKRKTDDLYYEVIANKLRAQLGDGDPRCQHHDLRAAAGARRGPGRRIHDHDRGPG